MKLLTTIQNVYDQLPQRKITRAEYNRLMKAKNRILYIQQYIELMTQTYEFKSKPFYD